MREAESASRQARQRRRRHARRALARDRRIRNSNSTCLNGRALKQDLERALGREIRIANDANCFALSEAIDGAAREAPIAFGVILGTGVGGGIVVHGRVLHGANAIAGEWGHNPLPWPRADELPGPRVLLRQGGLHRDFSLGTGARARPRARTQARNSLRPRSSRVPQAGDAAAATSGALRGPARARARLGDQRARSARDRARRRAVEHRAAVCERAEAVGRDGFSPTSCATRLVRELSRRFERRARRGVLWEKL